MIYLYINSHQIKVLILKKTILGQQETLFFEKKHEATLLDNGRLNNVDILASAIKEALSLSVKTPLSDKQVTLTLPQESFYFLRTEVPADITQSAIQSFVNDKARTVLPVDIEQCASDFFVTEYEKQKTVTFYAIEKEVLLSFQQALSLINLKIHSLIPETLAYYKLFDKTIRKEKKEQIFYVTLEENEVKGYYYDSLGLIDPKQWTQTLSKDASLEKILKTKAVDYEEKKQKLNRLILSGKASETIRQDTFTKAVGVWTNPLKRIVPTFYNDYLKMLVLEKDANFPLLSLDVCFGSFIFDTENKSFSLLKGKMPSLSSKISFSTPKISLPKKEIIIFVASFIVSFILFMFVSKTRFSLPQINFFKKDVVVKPTITATTPTPTPTPSFVKEELKVKVLNGSGTPGKATTVKDILKNKGYQDIVTGNADNFDFTTSELQVKKSKTEATMMIQKDLVDYVSSFKTSVLASSESADVILTIGKDFK